MEQDNSIDQQPKKRGRKPRTATEFANQPHERGHERKDAESQRKEARRPMGVTLQLDVPQHIIGDGYKGRWFSSNRVPKAQAAWWKLVDGQTRPSGTDTLYLMRIKQEYWDESQVLKQKRIHETTKAQVNEGVDYIPDGHKSAATIEHF